jgi:hypothetical protein
MTASEVSCSEDPRIRRALCLERKPSPHNPLLLQSLLPLHQGVKTVALLSRHSHLALSQKSTKVELWLTIWLLMCYSFSHSFKHS